MVLAYPRALSPGVRRSLGGEEPVDFDVDGGVSRLRVRGRNLLVLHQRPPRIEEVLQEADRLLWLDGRVVAPQLVATGRAGEGDEAVVVELDENSSPVAGGLLPVNPELLATELGRALGRLHQMPTDDCPFESATGSHFDSVVEAVEREEREPASDGPYAGRAPADLIAILADLLASVEESASVFIHAGLSLDRVWFAPDGVMTITGWDQAGLGDRHLDLAAAAASVAASFGPATVGPLYEAYGLDNIDARSLDAHQLLAHLMP